MIGFVHRQAGLRSVARFARSGIDDPSHAGYSACFAKVDGAQHIAARVELGIGHRCVKIDLRGKVEDDVRVCARDDINYFRSLMSVCTKVDRRGIGSLQLNACSRLAAMPVQKLSIPTTWWPSARRRSTRFHPMNPAAPVTKARMISNPLFG